VPSNAACSRDVALDQIEARARAIAGAVHKVGAIPARCWRQAIAERFLGERVTDQEWAKRMIERWESK
jgi:hypothetical protein